MHETVPAALRRAAATRTRRVIVLLAPLLGALAAAAVAAGSPVDRTFAGLAGPTQSVISILVPFTAVLLASDRGPGTTRSTLIAAPLVGVAQAACGAVICVIVLIAVPAAPGTPDPWAHTPIVLLGSVLVQVTAALIGTGLGGLIPWPVVAAAATIVLPLGLLVLLGATGALRTVRDWTAPFAPAQHLLAGTMTPLRWAEWVTVFALWAVGLNLLGAARRQRSAR